MYQSWKLVLPSRAAGVELPCTAAPTAGVTHDWKDRPELFARPEERIRRRLGACALADELEGRRVTTSTCRDPAGLGLRLLLLLRHLGHLLVLPGRGRDAAEEQLLVVGSPQRMERRKLRKTRVQVESNFIFIRLNF